MDIAPATNGRRVEPKISEDLIKRIQAAEKAKTRKEIKKEYDPVSIYSGLCSWLILAGSSAYPLWGCRHGDVYITKVLNLFLCWQDDPAGISPSSGEKPKSRVKKEKPEKAEKAEKPEKNGLKQTKLTFKKEPKKVSVKVSLLVFFYFILFLSYT